MLDRASVGLQTFPMTTLRRQGEGAGLKEGEEEVGRERERERSLELKSPVGEQEQKEGWLSRCCVDQRG